MNDGNILSYYDKHNDRRHNEILPDIVNQVIEDAGINFKDIDTIAVSIGPGSFTGLRVGLSYAKGIALACQADIAPVDTLSALTNVLAKNVNTNDAIICPLISARRKEMFGRLFRIANHTIEPITPHFIVKTSEIHSQIPPHCVIGGSGWEANKDELGAIIEQGSIVVVDKLMPSAKEVALECWSSRSDWIKFGNWSSLEPHYQLAWG